MPSRVSRGQVQAAEGGVAVLEPVDDAQALAVVVEAAVAFSSASSTLLAGVAEGRVAEVVREHDRLGEILVQRSARAIVRAIWRPRACA